VYEVECKVASPHEPVRERLSALDADAAGTVEQVDTYYDAPHRSFPETDEALRVRREDDGAQLTYKGPLVDAQSKTRAEHETAVGSAEEMANVLDALGFVPAATVEKSRERFRCRGYTVALDSVADLGTFVEVEGEAEIEEEIERVRDGARDLLTALDCDPDEQIRTSYLELLSAAETDGRLPDE
jgi:adenylate cyclase class 2